MLLINIITIIKITRRLKIFIKRLLNLIELLKVKQARLREKLIKDLDDIFQYFLKNFFI